MRRHSTSKEVHPGCSFCTEPSGTGRSGNLHAYRNGRKYVLGEPEATLLKYGVCHFAKLLLNCRRDLRDCGCSPLKG
jgi:hypothetical protein